MAMNYFETITKFLPEVVDEYFVQDSKTKILENGSKFIDVNFNEAGYVKIADILMDGMSNYYRTQEQLSTSELAGYSSSAYNYANHAAYAANGGVTGMRDGFAIGGVTLRWEIFKLQWCRGRQFRIDHISNEETAKVVTGHLVEQFHRLKVIPEVDACRFGMIADTASVSLGNLVTEAIGSNAGDINSSTILGKFFTMRTWLLEHEVPLEELVWFMTPEVYAILVNSSDLTKYITQSDYKSEEGITIQVLKFNGVPIIEVPSSRFFSDVQVTDNGFTTGSNSKAINYILCSRKCIVPIRKIEYQKMYDETMSGIAGFYGTMFNYLLYHGVVIPRNKLVGCFVSVGAAGSAATKTNVLSIDARSRASRYWLVKAFFTAPSGLRGQLVYAATDQFTVGSSVTIDGSTIKKLELGEEVDTGSTAQADVSVYFALVDYRGICIAESGAVKVIDV